VVEGRCLLPVLRYAHKLGRQAEVLPSLLERAQAFAAQAEQVVEPRVATSATPLLRIYSLGQTRIELDGQTVQWPITQSRDLFFFLLQSPQGLRKDEIGAAFWPDHAPHKLDGIFRSTMYRLRRTLFRECVVLQDQEYRFNRDINYWFDAEAFETLLNQAEQEQITTARLALLEQVLQLYSGDYVPDIYAEWCELRRERLQERYQLALETLARLYTGQGQLQRAIATYQAVLAYDKYQEYAYRGLMYCYYRLGDRALALEYYQTCVQVLQEELSLRPTRETEQLLKKIMAA